MKRRTTILGAAVALAALTACTPQEHALWLDWFAADPTAATEFADDWVRDHQAPQHSVWDDVAECESGGNWSINTGNGYSGGLQFLHSSWRAYGGEEFAPLAYQASRAEQIVVAERILADAGWGAWPTCSRQLGLR